MTIVGWESRYREILKEFGYSRNNDNQSCRLLDLLLPKKVDLVKIRRLIENKPVFIVHSWCWSVITIFHPNFEEI